MWGLLRAQGSEKERTERCYIRQMKSSQSAWNDSTKAAYRSQGHRQQTLTGQTWKKKGEESEFIQHKITQHTHTHIEKDIKTEREGFTHIQLDW